jgi:hypothetical protein
MTGRLIDSYLHSHMRPDYPFKPFNDKRFHYILLMQTLAAET